MASTDFINAIAHPLKLLTLAGCYVPTPGELDGLQLTSNVRRLLKSYRLFAVFIHVANVVRSVLFLVYLIPHFDNSLAFYAQLYVVQISGSFTYTCESLVARFYLRPVVDALNVYKTEHGFLNSLHWIIQISKAITVFAFIVIVSSAVFLQGLLFILVKDVKFYYIYPLQDTAVQYSVVGGLVIYLCLPITGFLILYSVLVKIAISEFDGVSQHMHQLLVGDNLVEDTEVAFSKLRARHVCLREFTSRLSRLLRLYTTFTLLTSVTVLFFVIYALASGQMSASQVLAEMTFIAWDLTVVLYVCIRWGHLPAAANAVAEAIKMVSWSDRSVPLLLKFQLLVSHCSGSKVGIDIFGIFTIDSSTVAMVVGTVVTYGVVVLQFQLDIKDSPDYHCVQNSTCGQ